MRYEEMRRGMVGVAFVAGPLLLLVSAVVLLSGVGRDDGVTGYGSPLEGLIGFFGFVLMVPVITNLAGRLGQYRPRLAIVAAVTGLLGFAGGGVVQMTMRVLSGELVRIGVPETAFVQLQADLEGGQSILLVLIGAGPLVPLTSILLGIGFLLARQARSRAWLLLVAGVSLMSGQLFLVATDVTYSLALLLWAVALVPVGFGILRDGSEAIDAFSGGARPAMTT